MNENDFSKWTLFQWLSEEFFPTQLKNVPFLVIYDKSEIFKEIIQEIYQQLPNQDEIKILLINASTSPQEYIQRLEIVEDFNEIKGWYDHKWVIYIYGVEIKKVEEFQSFLYYQRLGTSLIFTDLMDFLSSPIINLINESVNIPILTDNPILNKEVFNSFLSFPIGCWRTTEGKFLETGFWISMLNTSLFEKNKNNFEDPIEFSPYLDSAINRVKNFELTDLILESILKIGLNTLEQSENPKMLLIVIEHLFNFIAQKLNYNSFLIKNGQFNFEKSMIRFIANIIKYGKPVIKSDKHKEKSSDKTKQRKLLSPGVSNQVREIFRTVLKEWVNQDDPECQATFGEWMKILRNESPKDRNTIKNITQFNDFISIPDFTGLIDILFMDFLLEHKNPKKPTSIKSESKELLSNIKKIDDIITKRKKLWGKIAKNWWDRIPLFEYQRNKVTLSQMWNVVRDILYMSQKSESLDGETLKKGREDWTQIKDIAWEFQSAENRIMNFELNEIIQNVGEFATIKKHYLIFKQTLKNNLNSLNILFQAYYRENYEKIIEQSNVTYSLQLFNEIQTYFEQNVNSAIIFCDGLRADLTQIISNEIKQEFEKHSAIVKESSQELEASFIIAPSKTSVGWNSLLTYRDALVFSPKYKGKNIDGLECKIQINNTEQLLNDHSAKEKRIIQIFDKKTFKINIIDLDPTRINEEIKGFTRKQSEIKQQNAKKQKSSKKQMNLPIIWYSKIDDHKTTQKEFFRKIDTYIQEIKRIVKQLHIAKIEYVYVLTDHGFIFSDNKNMLKEKPSGYNTSRYSITNSLFTEKEKKENKNWIIISDQNLHSALEKRTEDPKIIFKDELSLIFPSGYGLFRKTKGTESYVHGGISFQECDVRFLKSHCKLYKTVEIEQLIVKDHEEGYNYSGESTYILKRESNRRLFLEIQVISFQTKKDEKLKPIEIRMISETKGILIKPNKKYKLAKNQSRNYKIYFEEDLHIDIVKIQIIDELNQILITNDFKITQPSAIPDLF